LAAKVPTQRAPLLAVNERLACSSSTCSLTDCGSANYFSLRRICPLISGASITCNIRKFVKCSVAAAAQAYIGVGAAFGRYDPDGTEPDFRYRPNSAALASFENAK
jgi:hypothetical protein